MCKAKMVIRILEAAGRREEAVRYATRAMDYLPNAFTSLLFKEDPKAPTIEADGEM